MNDNKPSGNLARLRQIMPCEMNSNTAADAPAVKLSATAPAAASERTMVTALDSAAQGSNAMTFFDGRGEVATELPYSELRQDALATARHLLNIGARPGDKIAIVAETCPEFVVLFFGCQYAGMVPVPMPAVVNFGGGDAYEKQLEFLVRQSESVAAFATPEFLPLLKKAVAANDDLKYTGTLEDLPVAGVNANYEPEMPEIKPDDIAYIQYTSGSTRVARGAVITQRAVMANLDAIIRDGLVLKPEDRFFSWLPFYHDMGLVGKVLLPVASALPIGYLGTRDFAKRPRLWLTLMHRTQATISFGPPFAYELCARRLREGQASEYSLENWRIAGVGAEMIRPQQLNNFAEAVDGSGFSADAFLPSYGMAEVGVAISFARLSSGFTVDRVIGESCSDGLHAQHVEDHEGDPAQVKEYVNCGRPLAGTIIEVRDDDGRLLEDRAIGHIWVQTPSAMQGYLNEPEATAIALQGGWINTGDLGYKLNEEIIITGRAKDLIIVNGRNIWPQDLEALAENDFGIRPGGAMAFALEEVDHEEVVMLVQYRERDEQIRSDLKRRMEAHIRSEFGVDCQVHLVDAQALPRTSSGKPSRSQARRRFLERRLLTGAEMKLQATAN